MYTVCTGCQRWPSPVPTSLMRPQEFAGSFETALRLARLCMPRRCRAKGAAPRLTVTTRRSVLSLAWANRSVVRSVSAANTYLERGAKPTCPEPGTPIHTVIRQKSRTNIRRSKSLRSLSHRLSRSLPRQNSRMRELRWGFLNTSSHHGHRTQRSRPPEVLLCGGRLRFGGLALRHSDSRLVIC